MNKKIKIAIVCVTLIALVIGGLFIYHVNRPYHYTPVTSEIILNDEASLKSPILLSDDESEVEIALNEKLNFVSDVDNGTANLSTRQLVFGFYECDINRVYDEYIPNITYTSSNEEVAKVDESGIITAQSKGEAVITVKADEIAYEIPIMVYKVVLVSELEQNIVLLNGESKSIATFEKYEIPFSEFYSSNANIVSVNENGILQAMAKGTAEVYTYVDEAQTEKISTKVTVKQPVQSLSVEDISIYEGETVPIKISYSPANADYGTNFTYTVSDTSIASINGNSLTGVKSAITYLTVTSSNGISAKATVKISPRPKAVVSVSDISKAEFDAYSGEKFSDGSPYATHIKISFSEPVLGFKINYVTDNIGSKSTGAAIYNNANVPDNTPIYFEIMVNESDVLTTRGFSYTNLDGSTYYYYLRESGQDGSILFGQY